MLPAAMVAEGHTRRMSAESLRLHMPTALAPWRQKTPAPSPSRSTMSVNSTAECRQHIVMMGCQTPKRSKAGSSSTDIVLVVLGRKELCLMNFVRKSSFPLSKLVLSQRKRREGLCSAAGCADRERADCSKWRKRASLPNPASSSVRRGRMPQVARSLLHRRRTASQSTRLP